GRERHEFQNVHRRRIEARDGNLIVRERLARQRISDRGASEVAGALLRGRHGGGLRRPDVLEARALPPDEVEHLVALDRTAGEAAVLLALQKVFFRREEIPRVERAIAQVVERAAVQLVGPRARDRIDHGAGAVALRGAVVAGLNAELLQRVGKRERLVLLEVRVRVARAVQPERHLTRLGAVGRQPQRAGDRFPGFLIDLLKHHAGYERAQLRGVAAVQRQLDDPVATWTAFTVAPGRTAPVLSVITPLIWPVCARAGVATSSARSSVPRTRAVMNLSS